MREWFWLTLTWIAHQVRWRWLETEASARWAMVIVSRMPEDE